MEITLRDITSGKNDVRKFMSIGMSDEILEWQSEEHNIPVDVISELLDAASIYVDGDKFNEVVLSEKIVVPKFVADWIELCKEKGNLVGCLQGGYRHLRGCENIGENRDWLFEGNNQEVAARAWIDGYEVEKEPLYHVKFPNITNCGFSIFLFKEGNGEIEIADNADYERMRFTEAEIKAIDERYWPFAVKVSDE